MGEFAKRYKKLWKMIDTFLFLIMGMVSWVYIFVKMYQIVYFMCSSLFVSYVSTLFKNNKTPYSVQSILRTI